MRMRTSAWMSTLLTLVCWPTVALAGMPSPFPQLTEWGARQVSAISFFAVVWLVSAIAIRWLWNSLAQDFSAIPRLSFGRALAGTALWSLALFVVLTMIAGSRELLTPGAWQPQGVLYKLASAPPAPPADPQQLDKRRENLRRLKDALWSYAAQHHGQFPQSEAEAGLTSVLWEVPDAAGIRYRYVPGQKADKKNNILLYEPAVHGDERLVLETGGEITLLSTVQIRQRLERKEQP